jgi:hypothetical protein
VDVKEILAAKGKKLSEKAKLTRENQEKTGKKP